MRPSFLVSLVCVCVWEKSPCMRVLSILSFALWWSLLQQVLSGSFPSYGFLSSLFGPPSSFSAALPALFLRPSQLLAGSYAVPKKNQLITHHSSPSSFFSKYRPMVSWFLGRSFWDWRRLNTMNQFIFVGETRSWSLSTVPYSKPQTANRNRNATNR